MSSNRKVQRLRNYSLRQSERHEKEKEILKKMAQAMIEERKRYLAEQALNVSTVKVQKNKRRVKEGKQSSAPEKKKAKLPKTTVGKAVKRKPKSSGQAALIPANVSVMPSEEMKALFDSVTESPLASSEMTGEPNEKEFDQANFRRIECPDGLPGCEVWHGEQCEDSAPLLLKYEWREAECFRITLGRAKASTVQCYWANIVDTICIALVQYCKQVCDGCKTDNWEKHTLCELPVKEVWAENRFPILARVDLSSLMARWASAIYANCNVCHSDVESLFTLMNPAKLIGMWQSNGAPQGEQTEWMELNTRMAKIEHPASYCSFDKAFIPVMKQYSSLV